MADIIAATAGSGDPDLGMHRATSSPRRVAITTDTIMRFLENCPDECTVLELRRALEDFC